MLINERVQNIIELTYITSQYLCNDLTGNLKNHHIIV